MSETNFNRTCFYSYTLMLFFAVMLLPEALLAASSDPSGGIDAVMCRVLGILTGPAGKVMGVFATCTLAIGLFFAKVTWATFIMVVCGMGILYSAPQVVNLISGGEGEICAQYGT